jgi:hypothetical protein
MKRTSALVFCFAVLAILVRPAGSQTADVSGNWAMTLNTPEGAYKLTVVLKPAADKLDCVLKSDQGEIACAAEVAADALTIRFNARNLDITLTGALSGSTAKGSADFGGVAAGDWTATRVETDNAAAPQGETTDVTGTWLFQVETSMGSGSPVVTLKQDGEKLTGRYKGMLGEADLEGALKGNNIAFSFKVNAEGMQGIVTYSGTVEKSTMKGTVQLGELGQASFTAKRQ